MFCVLGCLNILFWIFHNAFVNVRILRLSEKQLSINNLFKINTVVYIVLRKCKVWVLETKRKYTLNSVL